MSVTPVKWHVEWAYIENKYGKLLSYNLPRYNIMYASCKYQKSITEMIENGNYDLFLDVGAYVGLFSQIAAHHCKEVIAYEAHPFYYGVLLTNMRFYDNVKCLYKFISCEGDTPKMDEDIRGLVTERSLLPYNIEVSTLDHEYSLIWESLNYKILIKLDVEGSELKLLEASEYVLSKPNVHWHIDVHTQHGISMEKVLEYFPNRKITMTSKKVIKVEGIEK